LPADLLPRIEATYRQVGHYIEPSLEQWELGFMRDMNPEGEVNHWEVFARAFQTYKQKCCKGKRIRREQARDIIRILSLISMAQPLARIHGNAVVKRQLLQCFTNAGGVAQLPMMVKL
jgi:hypothetical protein